MTPPALRHRLADAADRHRPAPDVRDDLRKAKPVGRCARHSWLHVQERLCRDWRAGFTYDQRGDL